jgi:hypothetical protein
MGETKVSDSRDKENTPDPPGSKRPPAQATTTDDTVQIVLTLSAAKGDVLKVETLSRSGQRTEISEGGFAALAGEDEIEELGAAIEEAYAAGIVDALGEEDEEDEDEDEDDAEQSLRELILGRSAGRLLIRRGVRRLILRRALRRQLLGQRASSGTKSESRGRRKRNGSKG